jgi:hypothetical protein
MTFLLLLACGGPQDPTDFLDTGEFTDQDQDGFGKKDDCNDLSPSTYPGATETCDSRDEDCDDAIDEGAGPLWYADADEDGYGDAAVSEVACTAPSDHVSNAEDCNDALTAVNPGATESCNALDDDCDDAIDEAGEAETFYRDADEDGFGDAADTAAACTPPSGYVDNDTDGDDADSGINPDAIGDCSGDDVDCSGWIELDESPGNAPDCEERSCLELLAAADGPMYDGLYWIDPTVSGNPYEAWCDMATDGGGYTFLKFDAPGSTSADTAERACNDYGLNLFIPRTEDHLASAWAVANDTAAGGEASGEYLAIMGIYPDQNGATCIYQGFNNDSASCAWSARDDGDFWVSDMVTLGEPNGDNDVNSSMDYTFDADGIVTAYNDTRWPGGSSEHFLCSRGNK